MKEFVENIIIIIKKEFKEQRQKVLSFVILVIMLFLYLFNLVYITKNIQRMGVEGVLPLILNNLFTHQALSFFMISSFMFLVALFYKEKQSNTLECLLITPLSPKVIWLGKSFFLFIVGFSFSCIASLLGFIILNLFSNSGGPFVFPNAPSLFFFVVIFPIFSFLLSSLLGIIQLLSSGPTISNFLYLLIAIGYLGITSARLKSLTVNWVIIFLYFILLCIILILILILAHTLSRERIILSNK